MNRYYLYAELGNNTWYWSAKYRRMTLFATNAAYYPNKQAAQRALKRRLKLELPVNWQIGEISA